MKIIKTKVYTFDELDEKGKEKAREWAREFVADYEWWDSIYEDAKTIGLEINEFDTYRGTIDGKLIDSPENVIAAIEKNHRDKTETYATARAIKKQLRKAKTDELLEEATEALRYALLEDYLVMLRKEYKWMFTDEYITYGNKRTGLQLRIDTANRYHSKKDAKVYKWQAGYFRNDISYLD